METNVLLWSCTKNKFWKVNARMTGNFKEFLGKVKNIEWELEIFSKETYLSDRKKSGSHDWDITLNRNEADGDVKIKVAKMFHNQMFTENIVYKHGVKSQTIFNIATWTMANYCLDLIFIFEEVSSNDAQQKEIFIENMPNVLSGYKAMFEKEYMTDVTLQCESIVLKAHKNILSIQSPVFEAMFANPTLEKETNTVIVKDMNSSVVRAMVVFMYSGKIKIDSVSMVYDLLYAAEKYQIKALKEGCINYLKSNMSRENVVQILEISDLFDKQLKLQVLSFLKNHFEEIKRSREWDNLKLKNPILALEVYTFNDTG